VSSADLAAVVSMLEERCPKALDKSSPDEVDIVVDAIDTKTFRELEKLVLDKVPEGSRDSVSTPKSSRKSSKRSSSSKKAKTEA
jgi:formate-dependent phosphoribosylglycinamide formyltransferase (GAR transformylase)